MSKTRECYKRAEGEDLPRAVFEKELEAIKARRAYVLKGEDVPLGLPEDPPRPTSKLGLHGLAISGGGIRSATFSLGVLQAFAQKDILKYVDYLSTVSGGGYTGCSLTWALYGKTTNEEFQPFIDSFSVGPEAQRSDTDADGNPQHPYTGMPVGTADPAEARPDSADPKRTALLRYFGEHGKYLTPGAGIGGLALLGVLIRGILVNLLLWVSLTVCAFFLIKAKGWEWVFDWLQPSLYIVIAGVVICVIYGLGTYFARDEHMERRYKSRRLFEQIATPYFVILFCAFVIGTLGPVHAFIDEKLAAWFVSPMMMSSGAGVGIWTYLTSAAGPNAKRKVPLGLVATIGSVLLIYGGILGAYGLSDVALREIDRHHVRIGLIAILVLLFYGQFANSNFLSAHRFYRDRLMETFLPEIERAIEGKTGPSYPANRAPLSSMWDPQRPRGPYHIVNTNLVMVDSVVRKLRARGGECFILSPFFCGSDTTAWVPTKQFAGDRLTLATAMAISGAAANPNAGVGGKGLTRNRLVSVLMALLNLRLGYWVRNPDKPPGWAPPNHFRPGLYELTSGFKASSPWLQLSDGGHFEDLGLYELVRRRMRVIVVLDAGDDPGFKFADLQTASRRVYEDFGTRILFTGPTGEQREGEDMQKRCEENAPEQFGPGALFYDGAQTPGFPAFKGRATRQFVVADIHYPDDDPPGKLIYIKTTMVAGLSVETQGYKDANPRFPDQSTVDQFFDPEQFEAYRELGYVLGRYASDEILANIRAAQAERRPAP